MVLDTIPTLSIFIEPKELEVLRNNVWNEELLPSKLVEDNISYDIGMTYRGDHTRSFNKKSYRVDFGTFHKRFGGKEIHLNAEYRDPSLIRNMLSFDFFHAIGSIAPNCKHVFIEINGEPAGIYLQLESVDEMFLQERQLPDGPIYYGAKKNSNFSLLTTRGKPKPHLLSGYERKLGNDEDDLDLERFIMNVNTLSHKEFENEIPKYLDVRKYLLWLCGVVCTGNYDGFIHNYAMYRNGESGLYELIPWDYDATWGRNWDGGIMKYNCVPIEGFNTLTARLLYIKDIREQYRILLEELLETSFTKKSLESRVTDLHKHLRPYIMLDPYKKKSIKKFDHELEYILQFISDRNSYLRKHLKDLK